MNENTHWAFGWVGFGRVWSYTLQPQTPATKDNSIEVKPVTSDDPNSKTGPSGFGTQDFVNPSDLFPYRVNFENDPTATAPAQRVDVTDQLDPTGSSVPNVPY